MPRKLLLADDSVTIQKVVAIVFAHEDFEVTTVANGEDAIARARELQPDIVLADVVMPGKDGYQVCEALKADPATRSIPVLLLAGTFEPFDEARADAAGADGHMPKPFESARLLEKVRQLVEGPRSESAPATAPGMAAARPPVTTAAAVPPRSPVTAPAPQPRSPFATPAAETVNPFATPAAETRSPFATTAAGARSPFASPEPRSPFAGPAPEARSPAAAPAPQAQRPAPSSPPAPSWSAAPRPPSSVILPPRPTAPGAATSRPAPGPAASGPFGSPVGSAFGSRPATAAPPPSPSTNVAQPPPNRAVAPGLAAKPSVGAEDPFARAMAAPSAPLGFEEDEILLDVEEEIELADEVSSDSAPAPLSAIEITAAGDTARPFAARESGKRPLPEAELAPVSRPTPAPFRSESQARTGDLLAGEPVQPLDLSELDALAAEPVSPAVFDELPSPPEEKAAPGAVLLGSPLDAAFERPAPLATTSDAASFLAAAEEAPAVRASTPVAPARTPAPAPAAEAAGDGGEAVLRAALAAASREVIEKIAWEVVPQLAEVIIREHLEQLIDARKGSSTP